MRRYHSGHSETIPHTGAPPDKKKFVLRNTSAEVVQSLSPNELKLWMNMRRLADAKTGALCFNGKPVSAERIQREAKMGPDRRKETMRSLMAKGLVLMVQEHAVREVVDRRSRKMRKRFIYKKVQYWVSEIPRPDWISSTVGKTVHRRTPHKDWVSSVGPSKNPPETRVSSADGFFCQQKKPSINSSHNPPEVVAAARSYQAEHIESAPPSEQHEQPQQFFTKVDQPKKNLPTWVHDELTEELYRGVHQQAVDNAFFDGRFLSPREQIAGCVSVAVTTLVTNRVAKLKQLDAGEIERRVLKRLAPLELLNDYEVRRHQVPPAVTREVVRECVSLLCESNGGGVN
jgi:hypothetical protein